jgi:hypothetical protein
VLQSDITYAIKLEKVLILCPGTDVGAVSARTAGGYKHDMDLGLAGAAVCVQGGSKGMG